MLSLGLTGGIGMGKSATAQLFRERSVPVVDTDELARAIVEPGQPALAEIARQFGNHVIGHDGRLDRSSLGKIIFSDANARKKVEDILHPRIRELWRDQLEKWQSEGHPIGLVVIPLLFETGAEAQLDATICVACSAATQVERLSARNWSQEEIAQRIAAQWPIDQKVLKSDYVIWNEGTLEIAAMQVDRIMKRGLGSRAQAS